MGHHRGRLFSYSNYLLKRTVGRTLVQISSVTGIGDAATDNRSPYLVTRAQEMGTPPRLDTLYEVNVPPLHEYFGERDDLRFLNELKLTIQGVDLPGTLRTLLGLLPNDQYLVEIHPEPNETALRLDWQEPSGSKHTWILRLDPALDTVKATDEKAAVNKVLLDRAIYYLLYHMYYDPHGPERWRKTMAAQDLKFKFPNARALEAYYAGQQRLNAYLRNPSETTELDTAEAKFRLLQQEMPQFVDGLMLLGLTLSEKRNEPGAIDVYERVEQLLLREANPDFATRRTLLQAQLYKATVLRKLYRWEYLHKSIDELEKLSDAIANIPQQGLSAAQLFDLQKIAVTVMGEKASGLAYYLILLYHDNFIKALSGPSVPVAISPTPQRAAFLTEIPNAKPDTSRKDRFRALSEELQRIYLAHKKALDTAKAMFNSIQAPGNADWSKDRNIIVNLLSTAEGYGLFRYAQVEDIEINMLDDGPDKTTKLAAADQKFLASCRQALARLTDADAAQPNHYIVLQDMGMIYADPRFDESGTYVPTAQRLFRRSADIKPDDFFGHQNLAILAVRQAYAEGAEFVQIDASKKDPISAGIESGERARKLRPEAGLILVALSQLYALRWSAETADGKAKTELLLNSTLAAAKHAHANPLRIRTSELQWSLIRLRGAASEEAFKAQQDTLRADLYLARVEAAELPIWDGRRLYNLALDLDEVLKTATYAQRFAIRWPR